MKIPMDFLDKVFIGHLHMDHFGDLDALGIGGVKMNRTFPVRVWGPSGATPEMGTKHAIEGLQQMLHWDAVTLRGLLDTRGERLEVTEFDSPIRGPRRMRVGRPIRRYYPPVRRSSCPERW